ncbi:transient receptor potential cation channel subfamily V member 3 isoform X1 [Micractinium conductrix]|uniref:Transient receptor potential cation channel subfamily V member 3 isoform X1 n=1 Tax=Micractinium conductrix TaxID=554055 RepID=A0A2P6VGL0_9CHLO|nr:transient receptor potential cation channel subfamily V member 3 isoform X1 [Micractinium conductrix]|eukprot:PSC73225.1 transient receptor potential cation channel subfamily V member 3 isoform X1 [Micractinium conductrix]
MALASDDEPEKLSLGQLLATGRGRATVAAELIALLAMSPFLVLEWGTITAYGAGWWSAWNVLDALTYVLQVYITVLHLTRNVHSGYLSIACALQCILLLFRLQYFSRVFTSTRYAFLEAIKEAISAISIYLFFMVLVILGFAVAFHVLFRKDQGNEEFSTISNAFLTMWANQSDLLDLNLMRASHNPVTAVVLAVAYSFVMGMVIVNMLIGLMSNALEKTNRHEATKMVLHKAQIIDELEETMPRWLEERFMGSPDFIHILRVDPDRVDKPDLGSMWKDTEQSGEGGGDAGSAELLAKVDAMQAQLDRLEALLAGRTPAVSTS